MADQSLNIKVHVDLPDTSQIRSEIEKAFNGLNDIDANIDLNSKGLRGIKGKIREALGKENYNINAKADVDGLANIERLKKQLQEVRALAREPIRIKTQFDTKDFADAQRKLEEQSKPKNRAFRPYGYGEDKVDTKADISGLQREKQVLSEVKALQREINSTQLKIAGSGSSSQVAIMKGHVEELKSSLDGLQKKLANVYSSKEWTLGGKNDPTTAAERSVGRAINEVSRNQGYKVSLKEDQQAAREQRAVITQINKALNEKVRLRTAALKAGEQETAVIERQVQATDKQLASLKKVAQQRGISNREIQEAEHRSNLSYARNEGKYRDQQVRSVSRSGGSSLGSGRRRVMNFTMDAWNTGQQMAFGIASAVEQLNEVDKAITKVTKVVPDGQAAVNKWKKNIYKDASEVGKTAPEFAAAVEQWATAGYNLKQSTSLAKTSVMGSFVGGVPVNDMVSYMSVPLKAFQKEGLRSKDIINSMNEVSNKHAIEMDDLGQAYQKASSTMASTGTTFSQMTGIITAAQEGTRAGGDAIGTAFKTISANLAQVGSGITKQAQNKRDFFDSLGVQLKDSKGNLKSTYQIMDQLSKKWKTMSKQDKNTASLYAAGKNHANIFSATMDNWGIAKTAAGEAEAQTQLANPNNGSAYKEFEKQKNSIEFHLASLKNAWGEFLNSITGGRSGINQAVDALSGLLKVTNGLANNKIFMTGLKGAGLLLGSNLLNKKLFGGSILSSLKGKGNWAQSFAEGLKGVQKNADGVSTSLSNTTKNSNRLKDAWQNVKDSWNGVSNSGIPVSGKVRRSKLGSKTKEPIRARGSFGEGFSKARKTRRKVNTSAISTDLSSAGTRVAKSNEAIERTSRAATKGTQSVSKFSRVMRTLGAGAGLVGAALPGVGLAIDGITLGLGVLSLMGVDPFKAMDKAMNPAKYTAAALNKEVLKTADSIDKTNTAIQKNGLVNGQFKADMKSVKDMNESIKSLGTDAKGNIGDDDFNAFKKQFNQVAKNNGLEIRIGNNQNKENVQQKVEALNGSMRQVKKDDINDLSEKANKQISNINKSLGSKSIDKLMNSSKRYGDALDKAYDAYSKEHPFQSATKTRDKNKQFKNSKEYKDAVEKENFSAANAEMWNSKNGQQIASNVRAAQKGLRDIFRSYADNLADGTIGKKDIAAMSDDDKKLATMGAVQNLRDLKGAKENDKSVQDAKNNLNTLLQSLGASAKQQESIFKDAFKGKNANLMRDLKGAGVDKQTIAAMAGIGAQYQQQYGKKWFDQATKDQSALESYQKSRSKAKQSSANAEYLIDPNTGFINYDKVAKFNSGATVTKRGRARMNAAGAGYKGSHMSVGDMLRLTTGLDGDPTKILNGIAQGGGKTSVANVAAVANNAQKYRLDKNGNVVETGRQATGGSIAQAVVSSQGGKKNRSAMLTGLDEARTNGSITVGQADKAADWINKNINSKGQAKTLGGFNAQTKAIDKMTENQFKQYAKGLSKAERNAALKAAQKNGQLTKDQAKDLKDFANDPKNKRKTEPDQGTGKTKKSEKTNKKRKSKKSSKDDDDDDDDSGKSTKNRKKSKKTSNKKKKKSTAEKRGLETSADAATRANTAKAMARQLRGKKKGSIGSKQLKNLQAQMKNDKERRKLAQKLQNEGKLSKSGTKLAKKKYGTKTKKNNTSKARKDGEKEEKAKQQGRDKVKKQTESKNKKDNNKKVKDAKKQGQKEAKAKSQGSTKKTTTKKAATKKSTPKKTTSKSTSKKSSGDSKSITKEANAAKKLEKQLKSLGKGNHKIKISANTKSAESKLKSLKKTVKSLSKGKNKIKVSANTSSAKSKIKSLEKTVKSLGKGNHKVKVTASVSGKSKVTSLKNALKGLKGKKVRVTASASGTGKVNSLKSAINGVHNKKVKVSASVSGTGKVNALKNAINGVHSKKVKISATVSGLGEVQKLKSAIDSVQSKSVTVSATKVETTIKKTKKESVAVTPQQATSATLSSLSVVSNPVVGNAIANGAQAMGYDINSETNGQKLTNNSESTEKVSEDYWRYMGNELYTGLPLDEQVSKLEDAVTQADDNMDKLISLAKQRIDLDNKQIAYQKTMQNAYQSQINDVLNDLRKYGFKTNGNQITNLDHAKSITGDNASKVNDLLGKYQTAYQNFSEATQKITELQTDIWQQGKNQEDYLNTKDQKMVEKLQRQLELVTTAIDNHKNILERQESSLTDGDYRMKLKNNSDQLYAKNDAVQQLLDQFNQLSVANFVGTKDADNAQNLYESLESIRDSITENLDSIDELKKSMRDTTLSSITENLAKYTENLNDSIDRLKNNVTNLQDGLLSGTTYNDLLSSDFGTVNLKQQNAYTKSVNDRIRLETQLDTALEQFAKKNVDRTAQVANNQLQIEAQKYNDMLAMAANYARGAQNEAGTVEVKYNVSVESDKVEINDVTHNEAYLEASVAYQKQMNDLKKQYNDMMSEANTAEVKSAINTEMVYKQLGLQEEMYKSIIQANQQAIKDLQEQMKNPDMDTEQFKTITDAITEYEQNNIDAQNNIKDAIKERFDYEKTLLDDQMDRYSKYSDRISSLVSIADALHLDGSTQASLLGVQYDSVYREYNNYLDTIQRLRDQQSKYEKNSFEYNQLKSMIDEYETSLDSTVTSLLDITKNQFSSTLESLQKSFEQNVNEGMTADQAKFFQDTWYNDVQKQLKLEEMRLKIVDLEDKTVEKRLAALDAQKQMSKSEADYVDKQIDLALAQQKLNNTLNKKDVRYLQKDENGKFNWTYMADQEQVQATQQEVNSAKQAIEEARISARNEYIEQIEEVASDFQDGKINQEEAKSRMEQAYQSKRFALDDNPDFDLSKSEDILQAMNDFVAKNKQIIGDYGRNSTVSDKDGYQEIVKGFGEQFKMVSKDLGEIFGKELREALSLPSNKYSTTSSQNKSVVVQNMKVELPNVENPNDFADAMKDFPSLALQHASGKY